MSTPSFPEARRFCKCKCNGLPETNAFFRSRRDRSELRPSTVAQGDLDIDRTVVILRT